MHWIFLWFYIHQLYEKAKTHVRWIGFWSPYNWTCHYSDTKNIVAGSSKKIDPMLKLNVGCPNPNPNPNPNPDPNPFFSSCLISFGAAANQSSRFLWSRIASSFGRMSMFFFLAALNSCANWCGISSSIVKIKLQMRQWQLSRVSNWRMDLQIVLLSTLMVTMSDVWKYVMLSTLKCCLMNSLMQKTTSEGLRDL